MSKVVVDVNFAMQKFVKCGIQNIDTYKDKAKKGLSKLLKMIETGEVGFAKLDSFNLDVLKGFVKTVMGKFNDLIIVGIGGSSLGFEAIVESLMPYGHNSLSFAERGGFPRVWIADNVDPYKSYWITKNCVPQDSIVCVITKSGTTVETISNFTYIYNWLESEVEDIRDHIVCITDNINNPLRSFAQSKDFKIFDIPLNVGGRFSVLTSAGMMPSAILGLDIDKFLAGAYDVIKSDFEQILILSAVYIHYIENKCNINVLMPYSSRLYGLGKWFCQLWAESLGKKVNFNNEIVYFGSTPVPSIGANDQHSLVQLFKEGPADKLITFIEIENHDFDVDIGNSIGKDFEYIKGKRLGDLLNIELKATELALTKENKPNIKIKIDTLDEYTLGYLFMLFEYIVPTVGLTFDINPFNQPGVEEGKQYAYGLMGRPGYSKSCEDFNKSYIKENDNIF